MMDIPRVKKHPPEAVQCDMCGGHGCKTCNDHGWVHPNHPKARKCRRDACNKFIPPEQVAVYCSNECAMLDAQTDRMRDLEISARFDLESG